MIAEFFKTEKTRDECKSYLIELSHEANEAARDNNIHNLIDIKSHIENLMTIFVANNHSDLVEYASLISRSLAVIIRYHEQGDANNSSRFFR